MFATLKKNNYVLYLLIIHIAIGFAFWLVIFELLKLG